jgi:hypothetical protein
MKPTVGLEVNSGVISETYNKGVKIVLIDWDIFDCGDVSIEEAKALKKRIKKLKLEGFKVDIQRIIENLDDYIKEMKDLENAEDR